MITHNGVLKVDHSVSLPSAPLIVAMVNNIHPVPMIGCRLLFQRLHFDIKRAAWSTAPPCPLMEKDYQSQSHCVLALIYSKWNQNLEI